MFSPNDVVAVGYIASDWSFPRLDSFGLAALHIYDLG
jgi:hypothetical protein